MNTTTNDLCDIQNHKLHFQENIVFIHGALCSNLWWSPLLDEAHRQNIAHENRSGQTLLFGLPGHNGSIIDSGDQISPKKIGALICEFLSQKGLTDNCLVAHSFGGLCALEALHKNPKLFKKVVLINPHTPVSAKMKVMEQTLYSSPASGEKVIVNSFDKVLRASKIKPAIVPRILDEVSLAFEQICPHFPKQLESWSLEMMPNPFGSEVFGIHSEDDSIISAETFKTYFQNGKVPTHIYQNLGHCPHINDPASTLNLVSQHFNLSPIPKGTR